MTHVIIVKLKTSAQETIKRIKIVRKIVCNTFISQKIVSRLYQKKHSHVRQRKITKQKNSQKTEKYI